jgi:small subunit ribosomal protein S7e
MYVVVLQVRVLSIMFQSVIIYVPIPQLKSFQKIQTRLVRELEKKFCGRHVVFIGERKILPKPTRKTRTKNKQKRPRR